MTFETLDETLDMEVDGDFALAEEAKEAVKPEPEIEEDPYEAWGEVEDKFVPKGGGGGGKKKHRDPQSKTAQAKRQENIGYSVEKKSEEAKSRLKRVLGSFPSGMSSEEEDRHFEKYVSWINSRITKEELNVDEEEFRVDEFIPGMHAGGQGMQTSRSGRRAVHLPTYIEGEMGKGGRSGTQKEQQAKLIALKRVEEHLKDWVTYKQPKPDLTDKKYKPLKPEEITITTQDLYEVMVA